MMATDAKESDTEDYDRPDPPKRLCIKVADSRDDVMHQAQETPVLEPETEHDRTERLIREKLRKWQACQVARGFVDNTINRIMEHYILAPQADASQFRLFRGTEMEDTAVMMAIRNHGLVHSDQLEAETSDIYHSLADREELTESRTFAIPLATTSSKIILTSESHEENIKEKIDEGDEQDFLERAVAEAIKIKGLSALSVDYG